MKMKSALSIESIVVESVVVKGFKIEFEFTAEEISIMYKESPAMFAAMSSLIASFNKE